MPIHQPVPSSEPILLVDQLLPSFSFNNIDHDERDNDGDDNDGEGGKGDNDKIKKH